MRVMRILIYDGPDEWITETLARSLPDGRSHFTTYGTITVESHGIVTLKTLPGTRRFTDEFTEDPSGPPVPRP